MRVLIYLFALLATVTAEAQEKDFFLNLGEKVYVRHKPAAKGAPTLVLLNGLTYSTSQWAAFVSSVERLSPETGILRYDMRGMGRTLLQGPLPVNYSISLQDQVELLEKLIRKLNLKRVQLIGLSYGGGVGISFANQYPRLAERLVLMAPFTEALEEQDRRIKMQVAANRIAFPFNPATDEELYDYFLRQFVFSTYPVAEPIVLENPFKLEAVFRMVQGIRKFQAKDSMNKLPRNFVHLVLASQDQYIPGPVMERFWDALPRSARASRIDISYSEHKIPEAIPSYAAAWVLETVNNPQVSGGKEFSGNTWKFTAVSGSLEIELPRP